MSYYMAQALDNISPNHFVLRDDDSGELEQLHEPERQEEVYKLISLVARTGTVVYENGGVELTQSESNSSRLYLLQVPSVEPDVAGRIAPILCYRAYDDSLPPDKIANIAKGLHEFAASINRSISTEVAAEVSKAFEIAQKKKPKTQVANPTWGSSRRNPGVDAAALSPKSSWPHAVRNRFGRNALTLWDALRKPFGPGKKKTEDGSDNPTS